MDKPVVSENKEFLKKLYYEIFKSGRTVENIPKLSSDKYFDNNNIKNTVSNFTSKMISNCIIHNLRVGETSMKNKCKPITVAISKGSGDFT